MPTSDAPSVRSGGGVKPLKGVRVLDLSTYLPGNLSMQILADFGADVIKVERPGGDPSRAIGQAQVANRGKRSIVLDLKDQRDADILRGLVGSADVFLETLRPGVMDRLSLGYEYLKVLREDLIYVSLSGYGQDGPWAQRPGHDINYLAASGALAYSGHWGEPPRRSGIPVGDIAAGLYTTMTVLLAMRQRDLTGEGAHLDISLFDAALSLAATRAGVHGDADPAEQTHLWPVNDLFVTADGKTLAIGAIEEHLFQNLRSVLVRDEPLFADSRLDTASSRHEHGDFVKDLVGRTIARRSAAEWLSRLGSSDVPISLVTGFPAAVKEEHVVRRGQVVSLEGETHVLHPARWNGAQPVVLSRPFPGPDEDRAAILAELADREPAARPGS
jgi:crotonobetainyl-CoA:carnitine CoA-transferase CaiB-like acyl-CoA transferase